MLFECLVDCKDWFTKGKIYQDIPELKFYKNDVVIKMDNGMFYEFSKNACKYMFKEINEHKMENKEVLKMSKEQEYLEKVKDELKVL